MKKSIVIFVVVIFIAIIGLMGAFTFLTPKVPKIDMNDSSQKDIRIEDMPGVTDIKRISDIGKKTVSTNRSISTEISKSVTPKPTKTPRPPKPLPYPRISINYSVSKVYSIRNESSGPNNTFVIVMLDIRNYGYKYFDAHPTMFKILSSNEEIVPLVNISTGNTIDAVMPNNSRAKGNIIFLLNKKRSSIRKIIYMSNNYTILYKKVSPSAMEDAVSGTIKRTDRYWNEYGD